MKLKDLLAQTVQERMMAALAELRGEEAGRGK